MMMMMMMMVVVVVVVVVMTTTTAAAAAAATVSLPLRMSFPILSTKAPIIWVLYNLKSCSCLVPRSQNSSELRMNYRQGERRNRIRLQAGPEVANPDPRVQFSGKVQNAAFYRCAMPDLRIWIRH